MKILRLLGMTVVIAVPAMFAIGGLTFPCVMCVPRISEPVLISDLLLLLVFQVHTVDVRHVLQPGEYGPEVCGKRPLPRHVWPTRR